MYFYENFIILFQFLSSKKGHTFTRFFKTSFPSCHTSNNELLNVQLIPLLELMYISEFLRETPAIPNNLFLYFPIKGPICFLNVIKASIIKAPLNLK